MRRYDSPANAGDHRPTRFGALLGLTTLAGAVTHDVDTTKGAVLPAWGIHGMPKGNRGNGGRPGV